MGNQSRQTPAPGPQEHSQPTKGPTVFEVKKSYFWGTWAALLGECPTLDSGSGHGLGWQDRAPLSQESAWESLSLAPPTHSRSL